MWKYVIACVLTFCSAHVFIASASAGEYYRWTDVNGTVHYSDSPVIDAASSPGKAEKITIPDLDRETATLKRKPVKVIRKQAVKATNTSKIVPKNIPSFHPVPKPGHKPDEAITVINRISQKQHERERALRILKQFLLTHRAGGKCEIPYCGSARNLQAAHIVERSAGGKDIAGNLVISCNICHDHQKYVHGLPLSTAELLNLVYARNLECGISNFLTGDLIPNGGEEIC